MTRAARALLSAGVVCLTLVIGAGLAVRASTMRVRDALGAQPPLASAHAARVADRAAAQAAAPAPVPATPRTSAIVTDYCVRCHNADLKRGELSLEGFDLARVGQNADLGEKMVRKLQAGLMPPPGSRRPDPAAYAAFVASLESKLDAAAAARPNPGVRTFPRLNRPEYAAAIENLLAIQIDAGTWLPLDTKSANFDNIADEQALSATLLESYLNAAADISRLAIGDRQAPPVDRTYTVTSTVSQHPWERLEHAPYGTRGGMVVNHIFPADGEYVFAVSVTSGDNTRFEDIDISIDGERVAVIRYENGLTPRDADGRGAVPIPTDRVFVKAGQHRVAAAFVRRFAGPYDDLIRPHDWSFAGGGSGGTPITTLPHVRDLVVGGPHKITGISETPSRQKIFTCRPTAPAEERPCARTIVSRLGTTAYRRPLTAREIDGIMGFYDTGAARGRGFEGGVRTALEAILASPHFIFRIEKQPENVKAGAVYRVSDYDVASRLSFFIWGRPPDEDLIAAAGRGELATAAGLEKHARRMLADPRAAALGTRFAAQWLRLQDVDKVNPDPNFFPNFDDNLAAAMRYETETFFNYLVREDRSALDLYAADFTFVNERLARHYGFPGVAGDYFRKVTYPDTTRRGLLGHGSVLVQTSFANRTSPVLRGKWVMEVLLGTPPPPPLPDVPPFENTAESRDGKILTTRERMEEHRKNPTCNACHRFMDPIGLALDNFDVTGKWRMRENGSALDTRGDFYDGTPITTPAELSAALMKRPIPLVRTLAENLMAFALGRRTEYFDQPAIRAIARDAQAKRYRMSAFIVGVVTSDAFRMKRAE
jgi:cytochrome c553